MLGRRLLGISTFLTLTVSVYCRTVSPAAVQQVNTPLATDALGERQPPHANITASPYFVGSDGLHPNAWGEFQIANAFSHTLVNDFGLGKNPIAVPARDDPRLADVLP